MRFLEQEYVPAMPVDQIEQHPANPRRHDEAAIERAIDAHGFYGAVLVQRSTGRILAGNGRYREACSKGATTIPVMLVDVDDDEAMRILLNDNAADDKAGYHDDVLLGLLEELQASDSGLHGTGYSDEDVAKLITQLSPPPGSLDDLVSLDEGSPHECPFCKAVWKNTADGVRRIDTIG